MTRVTFFVGDAHISHLSSTLANKASSRQTSGEIGTPCLPSRLSRVRAPSPHSNMDTISLEVDSTPVETNLAARMQARRRYHPDFPLLTRRTIVLKMPARA